MRILLLAVLAFHWALFFGAGAAAGLMAGPIAGEGGIALFAMAVAGASSVAGALFLALGVECVVASGTTRQPRMALVSLAFVGAVLLLAFQTALHGPVTIGAGLVAPLAALAGSYAVFRLELARRRRLEAVNDNKSIGARLMAAGAARMAMMCERVDDARPPRAEVL